MDKNKLYELAKAYQKAGQDKASYLNDPEIIEQLQLLDKDTFYLFLKKTKVYRFKGLWETGFAEKCLVKLLNSPVRGELFLQLFDKKKAPNPALLNIVSLRFPSEFIQFVKSSKIFLSDNWEEYLYSIAKHPNPHVARLYGDSILIKGVLRRLNNNENYYKKILLETSIEDLLIHSVAYYEKFKRASRELQNNDKLKISVEVTLCHVLNEFFIIKAKHGYGGNSTTSIEENKEKLKLNMPDRNTPEGALKGIYLGRENVTAEKKLIRELVEFYLHKYSTQYTVDLYSQGLGEIEIRDKQFHSNKLWFATNDNFWIYRSNEFKYPLEGLYLRNLSSVDLSQIQDLEERIFRWTKSGTKRIWENNGLRQDFEFMGERMDFEELHFLLSRLAEGLMIPRRSIIQLADMEEPFVKYQERFPEVAKLFGRSCMHIYSENELTKNIKKLIGCSASKAKAILTFFTTNLEIIRDNEYWIEKPFLKFKDKYFWLSSFLRDRRWDLFFISRVIRDQDTRVGFDEKVFEEKVIRLFKQNGFQVETGIKFSIHGYSGDIDILAKHGNYVFVIEQKLTYSTDNSIRQNSFQLKYFNAKAVDQIRQIELMFEYYYKDIINRKKLENFDWPENNDELIVVPLIISNIYDFDDWIFDRDIFKVSILELEIILKNDLHGLLYTDFGRLLGENESLFLPTIKFSHGFSSKEQELTVLKVYPEPDSLNLWKDEKQFSPKDLIEAVRKNRVWKFLKLIFPNIKELRPFGAFDPSKKIML